MPHFPKPFFVKSRKLWYVQLAGKQTNLGPDQVVAFRRYHELMAAPTEEELPDDAALVVIEKFLEWCERHRPDSYSWYLQRLKQFGKSIPRDLLVKDLKPHHVVSWVDSHPEWSDSHKRGSTVAVQRVFAWAERMGHIEKSPVRGVEKPEMGKRERVISPDEYAMLLARYTDSFGDLLRMAWHTGCRPQESIRIEAHHVDLPNRRATLPPKMAKGKKRFRIIYLNDAALELIRSRVVACPKGPIFLNSDGRPWRVDAVNCRFNRLQEHLGRQQLGEGGLADLLLRVLCLADDVADDLLLLLLASLARADRHGLTEGGRRPFLHQCPHQVVPVASRPALLPQPVVLEAVDQQAQVERAAQRQRLADHVLAHLAALLRLQFDAAGAVAAAGDPPHLGADFMVGGREVEDGYPGLPIVLAR
jgi:integrase